MFVADGDGGINSRVARLRAVSAGGTAGCVAKPTVPPAYKPVCAARGNESACELLSLTCQWGQHGGEIEWQTAWVRGTNGTAQNCPRPGACGGKLLLATFRGV